ncbi:MAG: YraN family protein [Microthrixaceae bacterium]
MARRKRGREPAAGQRHDHLKLGRDGEDRVAVWYEQRGGTILARNWRCRRGEIDLVVALQNTIVFCEVKTRSSTRYGSPFEAVDERRVQRQRLAAMEFLRVERPARQGIRFDLAAVLNGRVEVRPNAF